MSILATQYRLLFPETADITTQTFYNAAGVAIAPSGEPDQDAAITQVQEVTFDGVDISERPIELPAGDYRFALVSGDIDNYPIEFNQDNAQDVVMLVGEGMPTEFSMGEGSEVLEKIYLTPTVGGAVTIRIESIIIGYNAMTFDLASAAELVAVDPIFSGDTAPVYLLYNDAGTFKNVLDNTIFDPLEENPNRPAPRAEHLDGYEVENGVWTVKVPNFFDPSVRKLGKDPATGLERYGNDFLLKWYGVLPDAAEIEVDVDDLTDPSAYFSCPTINITSYAEASAGICLLKVDDQLVPQDGLNHSLKFRARYNLAGDVSEWVESDLLLAQYELEPPNAPESIAVTVQRDRDGDIPDRLRVSWTWAATNPGDAVELSVIDYLGKKHLVWEESDNAVSSAIIEDVTRFIVREGEADQTAYRFSIQAKNRTTKSEPLVSDPVQLTSKTKTVKPPTPDEVAGTAEDIAKAELISRTVIACGALAEISAEDKLVMPRVATHIVNTLLTELKTVVMRGGSVSFDHFGEFKAKWTNERVGRNPSNGEPVLIPAYRSQGFTPSSGYKVGTKYGVILTDTQAKDYTPPAP